MDVFGDMFQKTTEQKQQNKSYNKPREKKINLFKETPEKEEINMDNAVMVNDIAIMLYDNKVIPEDIRIRFKKLFSIFKDKGFNIRILCTNSNELLPIIKDSFDDKKVNVIKPWEKFCDVNDFRVWTPSNTNIKNAANYVNNFDKLPTGIKYIKAAYMTFLTSYTGKNLVKYVLVYDPYYNKKDKLDYKKSKDTFDLYRIVNTLGTMSVYNVAIDDDLKTFLDLISK